MHKFYFPRARHPSGNTPYQDSPPAWPVGFGVLLVAHFLAGLAHFSHNAEFLPFYPGMPDWLTPERVYLAWGAVSTVGALAWGLAWRYLCTGRFTPWGAGLGGLPGRQST